MSDSRLTEERLRSYLDSNQVQRERLCLALLPLLGPFTQERARRPKGGPDGSRDIEALFQGSQIVWGAVGFRNGGGNDNQARREAKSKFLDDLESAVSEKGDLDVFVFFTNVDLTPSIVEDLKQVAMSKGVTYVDIFDLERLRHILDSPEGLIARLQYLNIPMTLTEQLCLVNKFGTQLHSAVTTRFDRVETILSNMEHFLAQQKPIFRFDIYLELTGRHDGPITSNFIGEEAMLLEVSGLTSITEATCFLVRNVCDSTASNIGLVTKNCYWRSRHPIPFDLGTSTNCHDNTMISYCHIAMSTFGQFAKLSDVVSALLTVYLTEGIKQFASRIKIDANGYELFDCPIKSNDDAERLELPPPLDDLKKMHWVKSVFGARRNFLTDPLQLSGRFSSLNAPSIPIS